MRWIKQAVLETFMSEAKKESVVCYVESMHAQISATFTRTMACTRYFEEVNKTSCALTDTIPSQLWGGNDVLRLPCKALHQPIDIIWERDGRKCTLRSYQQVQHPLGFQTYAPSSQSAHAWLSDLDMQSKPLVLHLQNCHYSPVTFSGTQLKTTKDVTQIGTMDVLFDEQDADELEYTNSTASEPEEDPSTP